MRECEAFLAAVLTGPLLPGDAIVVLAGEDADQRGNTATELLRQGAAPVIVCSGGLHEPPRRIGGAELAALLMARGVAPDRLIVEGASQHTAEQARNVVELARANGWKRILLVASPYHLPRAVLTFVKAMGADPFQIVPVPAAQLPWWKSPPGVELNTRLALFTHELAKVDEYAEDCSAWNDGLAYLQWCEVNR